MSLDSDTRSVIRHPGPPAPRPWTMARGTARSLRVTLPRGAVLMQAVAEAMEAAGADSGVIEVDGLEMGPYRFVGPGPSSDGEHAAWYSPPRGGARARITHGSAIVGRRDGAWWLHCHAAWRDATRSWCGHLLPDEVVLAEDSTVTLHMIEGARFAVSMNEETRFPIFHPEGDLPRGNAVLAKLAPHKDLSEGLAEIAEAAGFARARVLGVGSLIGARFLEGGDMASPISEVLVLPGALTGTESQLPVHCVDPDDAEFHGTLRPGGGPVCVTFELMLIEA
jgi:predicted DNA-binding protein with PD1-like motif